MECEKNCFTVNRVDFCFVFIDFCPLDCQWLWHLFLHPAFTLCPSCSLGYSLVLKLPVEFLSLLVSLKFHQLHSANLKRLWVFPFLGSITENWWSRKKQKELVWIIYKSKLIFRNYRCISAIEAVYFHSDTAWQFFWEKGKEGARGWPFQEVASAFANRVWLICIKNRSHLVCLPASTRYNTSAHKQSQSSVTECLYNQLTPDQQWSHIWLRHPFVLVSQSIFLCESAAAYKAGLLLTWLNENSPSPLLCL